MKSIKLSEFVGKKEIIDALKIGVKASRVYKKSLDHVLLHGPAGVGKTSLAHALAQEMGVHIKVIQGSNIQNVADMINVLSSLKPNSILFIDEIHSVSSKVAEILYPAMENYTLELMVGKNMYKRSIKIPFPDITIIAATTNIGNITKSLEERFGYIFFLDSYTDEEIRQIIHEEAKKEGVEFSSEEKEKIMEASRGIPRNTLRIIKRAKDYDAAKEERNIDKVIKDCGFLYKGLNAIDIKYLRALQGRKYSSLVNISYTLNVDEKTIVNKIEPYLYANNWIDKGSRGRYLTQKGQYLVEKLMYQIR